MDCICYTYSSVSYRIKNIWTICFDSIQIFGKKYPEYDSNNFKHKQIDRDPYFCSFMYF